MRNEDKHQRTKVLKISKGKAIRPIGRITTGGKEIEQVKEFCYLGSMITTTEKLKED